MILCFLKLKYFIGVFRKLNCVPDLAFRNGRAPNQVLNADGDDVLKPRFIGGGFGYDLTYGCCLIVASVMGGIIYVVIDARYRRNISACSHHDRLFLSSNISNNGRRAGPGNLHKTLSGVSA